MASSSELALQSAISLVERAFARLDAVSDIALDQRAQSAAAREATQSELTEKWQQHGAQLETSLAEAQAEVEFLRADNTRFANQLQALQQDYLNLQATAGHVVGRLDATVKQLDLVLEH